MTGPKGNRELCFPKTINVPQGEAKGSIKGQGPLHPKGDLSILLCLNIMPTSFTYQRVTP